MLALKQSELIRTDGYRVDSLEEFEAAFTASLTSGPVSSTPRSDAGQSRTMVRRQTASSTACGNCGAALRRE